LDIGKAQVDFMILSIAPAAAVLRVNNRTQLTLALNDQVVAVVLDLIGTVRNRGCPGEKAGFERRLGIGIK
jgi:hypothetical protein